ncbi:DUF3107 domain-containing protein [Microbacterium sp.]|uniref:DUF3107 domain-containing protein n=1 Tax=Microbacterium sp. TaxID=51671 RepID=UPI003C73CE3C
MEIRIGIANTPRELNFESALPAAEVTKTIEKALDSDVSFVTFADVKGNTYIVPTEGITFIEVGTEESRRVGFVA